MKKTIVFMLIAIMSQFCKKRTQQPSQNFKLFFVGDSITSDDPGNIDMNGNTASQSWPWYMKQQLNNNVKYQFRNHAVSGVGINEMQGQVNTIISEKDNAKINVVYLLGPINSISFGGMTGGQAYNSMRAMHEQLRAQGFKTVAITLTSRRQIPPFNEQQSQAIWVEVQAFNTLLIAEWNQFCDVLINLQSEPLNLQTGTGWGGYEAATESSYIADGVHYSNTGKSWLAEHYAIPAKNLIENNQTGIVNF